MKTQIVSLVSCLLITSFAHGQVADSERIRAAMTTPAAQLYESVAGGPGGIERMAGFDRRADLLFALDDPQRFTWQYWPAARIGLSVELMTRDQRLLAHALLQSILSSQGYLKATQIMQLEQVLLDTDLAGFPRSIGHYKIVLFGEPSLDNDWAWRFEGHHVSLSVAVAADGITVTPSFFGSNPAEIRTGPLAGLRVHGAVEDVGRALVNSLSARQRQTAVVSDRAPGEILTSQVNLARDRWDDWIDELQPEGIAVRSLNEMQQHWVRQIVAEAVDNYRDELAGEYREQIEIDELYFAWMGSTDVGEPNYFRVQGGDFVYEYDNVQNGGNHVHSVWRSKANDFGRGALADHYMSANH